VGWQSQDERAERRQRLGGHLSSLLSPELAEDWSGKVKFESESKDSVLEDTIQIGMTILNMRTDGTAETPNTRNDSLVGASAPSQPSVQDQIEATESALLKLNSILDGEDRGMQAPMAYKAMKTWPPSEE
jgi:hypothetical protein